MLAGTVVVQRRSAFRPRVQAPRSSHDDLAIACRIRAPQHRDRPRASIRLRDRDMRGLAAMRRTGERQFLVPETVFVRRPALDQRQRLDRLHGRTRDTPAALHRRCASTLAPSASTTATAPRWRLSVSAPRVTSTRTGLLICHVAACPPARTCHSSGRNHLYSHYHGSTRSARAANSSCSQSSHCFCSRSPRARRCSPMRAGRSRGATRTGRAPGRCRPRLITSRRACWSCPARPAAGRARSRCIAGSCSSARTRATGPVTTWSAGATRCAPMAGRRTGAGTATARRCSPMSTGTRRRR